MLHHHTASLQHRNVTRKKPRHFLKGRGRRGSKSTALPYAEARQDGGERVPRITFVQAEGWEEGTKGQGRHGHDLW